MRGEAGDALRITHYALRITHYALRITQIDCPLPTAYRLLIYARIPQPQTSRSAAAS